MASLDANAIRDCLAADVSASMDRLEAFAEVVSTNSYLLQQDAPAAGRHRVAVADHQTGGRGRQGREWLSAPGASLCLSLAYTFAGVHYVVDARIWKVKYCPDLKVNLRPVRS